VPLSTPAGSRRPTSAVPGGARSWTGRGSALPGRRLLDCSPLARTRSPRPTTPVEAPGAPTTPTTSTTPTSGDEQAEASDVEVPAEGVIRVRRIHRRDLNRVWEFLKRVFRLVNRETVEYQRPRTKVRFLEIYEEEGIEQLLFEIREGNGHGIVGYAECAYEVLGSDSWINERYFSNRDMRPLFVEEIAIHPGYQGRGIGSFVIEQLEHLARLRGCTHLVLEVAQNNNKALSFYRARSFYQLDAAIFLAKKVSSEPELLPPRPLRPPGPATTAAQPVPSDSPTRKRGKRAKAGADDGPAPPRGAGTRAKPVLADSKPAAATDGRKPAGRGRSKPVRPGRRGPGDSTVAPPVPEDSSTGRVRLVRPVGAAPSTAAARPRRARKTE
jgi:ribosomal protein S18 acetylase RimI-like enzyme